MLTDKEIALARGAMEFALENGAQKVRITLNKSLMELFGMLNGELDKVTHALDRSLQVSLFVDGRFGSFSSNRLEEEGLKAFLLGAIDTVRTLEPDVFSPSFGIDSRKESMREMVREGEAGPFSALFSTFPVGRSW